MSDKRFEQSATCEWCRRQVVSFVGYPRMGKGGFWIDGDTSAHFAEICLDCYAELLKWINARQYEPV